jgi:hypothetical protein
MVLAYGEPDRQPAYVTAWERLYSIAVRGRKARALIRGALRALDEKAGSE